MSEGTPRPLGCSLAYLTGLRLVLNTAFRLVYPFLPVIARGLGVPLSQAGYLVSARWIAGMATPGVIATVGKGEARRRVIVTGTAMFIVGALVTAATGVYLGALVGFVLMGLAKPTYDVASQSYISDRVPYATRARSLAVFELAWAGSLLIGAPFAGWLIARGDWTTPFWILGGLAVVGLLLVARFIDPDRPHATGTTPKLQLGRTALTLLAVMGLFTMAAEVMFVVFGAWLEGSFGLSLAALGGAALLVGLAELTGEGATLTLTDRIGKRRSVLIGLVISIGAFALLALAADSLGIGLALLAIALMGFEFTIVSSFPLASEIAPHGRTRYLSLTIVAMGLGRAIGAAAGPSLFSALGLTGPVVMAVAADLVAALLLIAWVRDPSGGTELPR
jgi:predicted MFS family arabinose efflux permease